MNAWGWRARGPEADQPAEPDWAQTRRLYGCRFVGIAQDGEPIRLACAVAVLIPPIGWIAGRMAQDEQRRGRRDGGDDD